MTTKTVNEYIETSKSMYLEACDTTSLIYIDLENETLKGVMTKFFDHKTTKTDLKVMFDLMSLWNVETSIIDFKSYDDFRLRTGSILKNGNLSRAFKALKDHGFIERTDWFDSQEYYFLIPFEILKKNI